MTKKFGPFIREVRIKKVIGQRALSSKIGVSASYLNDIEKEKRTAPKLDIIKKISSILSIDIKKLNDLAGYSKKTLAPDINDFITKNPKINSLIRTIQENDINEKQIELLQNSISKKKTKALIIAAGLGSRLKKHTETLPKCMLDFGGKT